MSLQDLIDTINEDPSQVREALELIKRQLPAYPAATDAEDGDFIPVTKSGGLTERLPLPILDRRGVTPLPDITALSSLNTAALVDGQQFSVSSYLPDTSTGSCLIRWRPDLPKSRHDGVLFFSPTVPMFTGTDTTDYRAGTGETDAAGNGVFELVRGAIIYDATIKIPSHYTNIEDALRKKSTYSHAVGVKTIVLLEAGHVVDYQVLVENAYFGDVVIRSEGDAVITIQRSALTRPLPSADKYAINAFMMGYQNATLPVIDCNFTMDASGTAGTQDAFVVLDTSAITLEWNRGCTNAGRRGLHVSNNSEANARLSNFDGALAFGFRFANGAKGNIRDSSAQNCGVHGIAVDGGINLEAENCNFDGAVQSGVHCTGAATLHLQGTSANNCLVGFSIRGCANAELAGTSAQGCTNEAYIIESSIVTLGGGNGSNSGGAGALISGSANVAGRFFTATNCGSHAVSVQASSADFGDSTLTGSAGSAVLSFEGADVNCRGTDGSGSASGDDFRVFRGATISASAAIGTLSQAASKNTADGIIFQ